MDIPWDDARLFLAVAETGSLSAAARTLRMTQPTVSRRLAELEEGLGEPLFERHAAGATLTAFGERLVAPARQMAEWATELTRVAAQSEAPRGVVRITAPPGIAHGFVAPFAAMLATSFPEITLEVVSSVRPLDLARREADIALRLGASSDDCVASVGLTLEAFAAERYASRLRGVSNPRDVAWIGWAPPFENLSPNTTLRRLIPDFAPSFASDDYLVQLRACELGLGAMLLPRPHPDFPSSQGLERLALDLPPISRVLTLLCPRSAAAIPRVRTVLAPLREAMRTWDAAQSAPDR
jgi:DNA-binding transcriptional LysR family regulator